MILSRRSFLTGLIAAPIIVRAGIIMPVKPIDPRPDIARAFAFEREPGAMHVYGKDAFGYDIVETIMPGKIGQKQFKYVTSIEFASGARYKPHPLSGLPGIYARRV
jgi:hypothetical protein